MPPRLIVFLLFATLLASINTVTATTLPYTPTRILLSDDDNNSTAWIFSPTSGSGDSQLLRLDVSSTFDTSNVSSTVISSDLSFLNNTNTFAYIPVVDSDGTISVLCGNCEDGLNGSTVWQFVLDQTKQNGTWSNANTQASSTTSQSGSFLGPGLLSVGINYPADASTADTYIYVFGGMCPNSSSVDASTWTSDASYSSQMLSISPASTSSSNSAQVDSYDIALSASRGGPIAEAGLTVTPLTPTYSNSSSSEQQNFVLLGGHTEQAFINMSQVALFSLPEQSWAFIGVDQPSSSSKFKLRSRSTTDMTVEPRSGHTAILSEDGTKIIVLGGWVGDISTPATPQLAVLELGSGYGGSGDWTWTIPTTTSSPVSDTDGIYGHGAALLPGGVMLVTGGYSNTASSSKIRKRTSSTPPANTNTYLFNITSNTWVTSYTNPSSTSSSTSSPTSESSSAGLTSTSQKVGLGTGLVLGASSLAGLCAVYLWYSRRLRRRRDAREKELYDLALNAARYQADLPPPGFDGRGEVGGSYPEMKEKQEEQHQPEDFGTVIKRKPLPPSSAPWAPISSVSHDSRDTQDDLRDAERTGLLVEVPSPTRGLRKNLHNRGPPSSTFGRGGIHTIDEQGEDEDSLSGKRQLGTKPTAMEPPLGDSSNRLSDPFKDPPPQISARAHSLIRTPSEAKRQRTAEIQGWVEDWSAAAAGLDLSRNASAMSRSQSHSHSQSNLNSHSGRGSPEKSDRTASNLSEASMYSITSSLQRSNKGSIIQRDGSFRSLSAGYAQALFAGAAAAMGRMYSGNGPAPSGQEGGYEGTKRAASLNATASSAPRRYEGVSPIRPSTANGALQLGSASTPESKALLQDYHVNLRNNARPEDVFVTPPESPIKDRHPPNPPPHQYLQNYPPPPPISSQPSPYSSLLPSITSTDFSSNSTPRRKPLGFLGSVKRALSSYNPYSSSSPAGSGASGAVKQRVQELESRSTSTSPTKRTSPTKQGRPGSPQRSTSANAAFWRGRKGRKDWDDHFDEIDGTVGGGAFASRSGGDKGTLERRDSEKSEDSGAEWDIEKAIERRLVQVMFTVPKERLRVVNADEEVDDDDEEEEKSEKRDVNAGSVDDRADNRGKGKDKDMDDDPRGEMTGKENG